MPSPKRRGIGAVKVVHDRVHLADPFIWQPLPGNRSHNGHERPRAESSGATKPRVRAPENELAQALHVVVVPVRRHDQAN